jgi:hypothetical protein
MEINGYYLLISMTRMLSLPRLHGKKGELRPLYGPGTTAPPSSGNWLLQRSYTQKDGKVINMGQAGKGRSHGTRPLP